MLSKSLSNNWGDSLAKSEAWFSSLFFFSESRFCFLIHFLALVQIMFQTFLFVCIFFLYIYWITLFRRVYAMKEIPLTLTTYCVSSLKQFFYFSFFMYLMVFMSYAVNYSRLPIEFLWSIDSISWAGNFWNIVLDYPTFLVSIFL